MRESVALGTRGEILRNQTPSRHSRRWEKRAAAPGSASRKKSATMHMRKTSMLKTKLASSKVLVAVEVEAEEASVAGIMKERGCGGTRGGIEGTWGCGGMGETREVSVL